MDKTIFQRILFYQISGTKLNTQSREQRIDKFHRQYEPITYDTNINGSTICISDSCRMPFKLYRKGIYFNTIYFDYRYNSEKRDLFLNSDCLRRVQLFSYYFLNCTCLREVSKCSYI